jgi:hypothetical protein
MKHSLLLSVCLVALSVLPAKSFSQSNQFDIVLEGPWILYEDDSAFASYPVLVAIAPVQGMDQPDATHFHFLQVGDGDGYYVNTTGLYCLIFGTSSGPQCAPSGGKTFAPGAGYPSTVGLLQLHFTHNASGSAWSWASVANSMTVLILPMPSSYSNASFWDMRFSDQFDGTGLSYKPVGGEDAHTTGIELHYSTTDPVTYFDLNACDFANPDKQHCKNPASFGTHTKISNVGTLNILMKSPDAATGCDFHVRTTYPLVTALLDKNANKALAAIEPAIDIDSNGQGIFEGVNSVPTTCLDKDPQKPGSVPGHSPGEMLHGSVNSVADLLDGLIHLIDDSTVIRPDEKAQLIPSDLRNASEDLDRDRQFPRISELDLIAALAQSSSDKAEILSINLTTQLDKAKSAKAKRGAASMPLLDKEIANYTRLLALYHAIQGLDREIVTADPTKGAKDCLAAIVQAVF